jgi:hypothetical protein
MHQTTSIIEEQTASAVAFNTILQALRGMYLPSQTQIEITIILKAVKSGLQIWRRRKVCSVLTA